jgi:hypothetical protein
MVKTHDWGYLTASSHYLSAKEIKLSLQEGDLENAVEVLDELIDSVSKIAIPEMRSHLPIIMIHTLKWKHQPQKRSVSWVRSIFNARFEIEDVQEKTPSVTKKAIESELEKAFKRSVSLIATEMKMADKYKRNFKPEMLT